MPANQFVAIIESELMHLVDIRRFLIVWSYVHNLYRQTFVIILEARVSINIIVLAVDTFINNLAEKFWRYKVSVLGSRRIKAKEASLALRPW